MPPFTTAHLTTPLELVTYRHAIMTWYAQFDERGPKSDRCDVFVGIPTTRELIEIAHDARHALPQLVNVAVDPMLHSDGTPFLVRGKPLTPPASDEAYVLVQVVDRHQVAVLKIKRHLEDFLMPEHLAWFRDGLDTVHAACSLTT